jgi:hypothetical protein
MNEDKLVLVTQNATGCPTSVAQCCVESDAVNETEMDARQSMTAQMQNTYKISHVVW